ncbi:response regulator [Falsirhodobacter halotolerans]|uniref:response regulator n=1 Tax=Falsirhodobacter halotolerans TaxID=1146892 RepID=UPI001FD3B08E|nr:response regulator [Falsirhodobacter halotolerans]MCJ8141177.1 response regulator [Falsirhodobacter halotolerans]
MNRPLPSLNVLLIEDEPLIAMDMQMMLEDAGHTVVAEATTMSELEDILPGIAPDVAFVDIQLGDGSSGVDACRLIRNAWHDTVVIFVTANPAMIPQDYAGGHGVIAKPFTQDGFMSAMQYLGEGISDPPPTVAKPNAFCASPAFAARWGA